MNKDLIAGLINFKVENSGKLTEEEAAADIAINGSSRTYEEFAARWQWSRSSVGRKIKILKLAAKGIIAIFEENGKSEIEVGTNHCETSPKTQVVGNPESEMGNPDTEQKERVFPPHTPPLPKEKSTPPLKEKTPLKGVKKEKHPPHALANPEPESEQGERAAAAPPEHLRLVERAEPPPFSLEQAEAYFADRLANDPVAQRQRFDANLLANGFFWHWEARDFTDEKKTENARITPKTWKRRAATWWTNKTRYSPEAAQKQASGGYKMREFR